MGEFRSVHSELVRCEPPHKIITGNTEEAAVTHNKTHESTVAIIKKLYAPCWLIACVSSHKYCWLDTDRDIFPKDHVENLIAHCILIPNKYAWVINSRFPGKIQTSIYLANIRMYRFR